MGDVIVYVTMVVSVWDINAETDSQFKIYKTLEFGISTSQAQELAFEVQASKIWGKMIEAKIAETWE